MRAKHLRHAPAPAAEPGAAFHAVTVGSAVVVALSLVTGLVGIQVGACAAAVLLGQGLYGLFRSH
jgi:hypothetical protein